ncbi:MAG: transposase [Bacteroidetes bacterium]|nr:transposase [Bacteroidota bacterium]
MKEFPVISEFYKIFPKKEDCIRFIEKIRWRNKPVCPHCNSHRITPMKKEFRYHCNTCNISFSVTVKTLFHNTRIPLQKWFAAIEIFIRNEKLISVRKLAEVIEVNKDTAWTMISRLKLASVEYGGLIADLIAGLIESDELYVEEGAKKK